MLDEIGDLPLGLQAKLLRVLEEGEIRRLGGRDNRAVDVRVIAATAKDLERAVEERPVPGRPLLPHQRGAICMCRRCASGRPMYRRWSPTSRRPRRRSSVAP